MLTQLVVIIFKLMINTPVVSLDQLEVFKLQFQQLVQRSYSVRCEGEILVLDDFTIEFDRDRIIKRKGYEILLENVESASFFCGDSVLLDMKYKGIYISGTFKLK